MRWYSLLNCECEKAGWCERRKRVLGEREFQYCKGTSGLSREVELAYLRNVVDNVRVDPEAPKHEPPGLLRQTWSFAVAFAKWASSGFKTPQAPDLKARLDACAQCEHNKAQRCELCGCFIKAKAGMGTEDCPDNPSRWPTLSLPLVDSQPGDRNSACCGGGT